MLEFYHGASFNAGFEVKANENFGFYAEFGKYLPQSPVANNYDQTGYTVSAEVKRYFKPDKSSIRTYFSAQYMQGEHAYTRTDIIGYYNDGEEDLLLYDVDKTFKDLSFRLGVVLIHKKRWTFDPYMGLGVRHHFVESTIDEISASELIWENASYAHRWIHDPGKKTYLKAHLGIRIGLRIF